MHGGNCYPVVGHPRRVEPYARKGVRLNILTSAKMARVLEGTGNFYLMASKHGREWGPVKKLRLAHANEQSPDWTDCLLLGSSPGEQTSASYSPANGFPQRTKRKDIPCVYGKEGHAHSPIIPGPCGRRPSDSCSPATPRCRGLAFLAGALAQWNSDGRKLSDRVECRQGCLEGCASRERGFFAGGLERPYFHHRPGQRSRYRLGL